MARQPSRGQRWQTAVSDAQQAVEALKEAAGQFDMDGMSTASVELETAIQSLVDVKEEYQEWYDNMPDGLRDNSPAGEKLEQVVSIDINEFSLDTVTEAVEQAVNDALEEVTDMLDEADGADLPLGFGRD